ncbi:MASE1 domain-containing protein [Actinopolymorpha sp. B11F2]|uniref:MASE1 domain-containing protein n=1 Tax=Actinopolymorpha sp. B11F2 TaxID=3160862 RepID=UPI0032E4778A
MVATGRPADDLKARAFLGVRVIGVAMAYYAGTYLSVLTKPLGLPVTSLWVSAGIALASLLLFDIRIWPAITLGSFLSNVQAVPAPEALLVSLGNTLAPVCAYLLLRRVGFRIELDRFRDALSLVLLGAFGAMSLSAALGTAALVVADVLPARQFLQVSVVWWSSDVLGVLVVAPFILVLNRFLRAMRDEPRLAIRVGSWRGLELAGLLLTTLTLTIIGDREFGVPFISFPLVVLAALRFQLNGVAPCALIVSAVAIDTAAHGYGLFEGRNLYENVVILQVFNGTFVLTGLLLAVVIAEWRQARADVQQTCFRLAEVVERLHQSLLPDAESYREMSHGEEQSTTRKQSTGSVRKKWVPPPRYR